MICKDGFDKMDELDRVELCCGANNEKNQQSRKCPKLVQVIRFINLIHITDLIEHASRYTRNILLIKFCPGCNNNSREENTKNISKAAEFLH